MSHTAGNKQTKKKKKKKKNSTEDTPQRKQQFCRTTTETIPSSKWPEPRQKLVHMVHKLGRRKTPHQGMTSYHAEYRFFEITFSTKHHTRDKKPQFRGHPKRKAVVLWTTQETIPSSNWPDLWQKLAQILHETERQKTFHQGLMAYHAEDGCLECILGTYNVPQGQQDAWSHLNSNICNSRSLCSRNQPPSLLLEKVCVAM